LIYGFGEQEMTAIPKKRTKGTHFAKQFVDLMDNSSGRLKKNKDMGISIRYFPMMSRERTWDNKTSDQSRWSITDISGHPETAEFII